MNVYEEKDEQLEEFRYQYRERLDQESEFGLERGKKKKIRSSLGLDLDG